MDVKRLPEFGDFPTRDDADPKDAVSATFEKVHGASVAADPARKPTRPKCGCQHNHRIWNWGLIQRLNGCAAEWEAAKN
jgi:hypothetical protein